MRRSPSGQLDRKLYSEIDKALQLLGGRWNRSARAHVFATDPRTKIASVLDGKPLVDKKKTLAFFATPEALADRLVSLADLEPGQRVLEPSAGNGNLVEAACRSCPDLASIVAVEIDVDHHEALIDAGASIAPRYDFLSLTVEELGTFDRVVMNPPFSGGADVDHVIHSWQFVAQDGLLVAITSPSWRFRTGSRVTPLPGTRFDDVRLCPKSILRQWQLPMDALGCSAGAASPRLPKELG